MHSWTYTSNNMHLGAASFACPKFDNMVEKSVDCTQLLSRKTKSKNTVKLHYNNHERLISFNIKFWVYLFIIATKSRAKWFTGFGNGVYLIFKNFCGSWKFNFRSGDLETEFSFSLGLTLLQFIYLSCSNWANNHIQSWFLY